MHSSRLVPETIFFCIHEANSMLRLSTPCSSRSTTLSPGCMRESISEASASFCCDSDKAFVWRSSGITSMSVGR